LRGDIRADLPRPGLTGITVVEGGLRLSSNGEPLEIELNAKDAAAWHKALLKPPPTLARKLGIGPDVPAYVTGDVQDATLAQALDGNTTGSADSAALLLALVLTEQDLAAALTLARAHPDKHIWFAYRKGKSPLGDTLIRTTARAAGFIDSKSCAVSDTLTATRYRLRTG
jgi:hypothetical protein